MIIKRPAKDACLYIGEATPLDPHFLRSHKADFRHIWQVYAVALGKISIYGVMTFQPIREVT